MAYTAYEISKVIRKTLVKIKNVQSIVALGVMTMVLTGCEEDKDSGVSGAGKDVSVSEMSVPLCGRTSKYATADFVAGASKGSVSNGKIDEVVRATQVAFGNVLNRFGLDRWDDLKLDPQTKRLSVCVVPEEGSGGYAGAHGFVVGPNRNYNDTLRLAQHELSHTVAARMMENTDPYALLQDYWFSEAFASYGSSNKTIGRGDMQGFIAKTGLNPVQVKTAETSFNVVRPRLGGDDYKEYPAYNTVFHYLVSQGARTQDFVNVNKIMSIINKGCFVKANADRESLIYMEGYYFPLHATDQYDNYEDIASKSTYCDGNPVPTDADYQTWKALPDAFSIDTDWPDKNGGVPPVGTRQDFELKNPRGLGTTYNGNPINSEDIFRVAFDEVMAPYGVTLHALETNFNHLVINNYL